MESGCASRMAVVAQHRLLSVVHITLVRLPHATKNTTAIDARASTAIDARASPKRTDLPRYSSGITLRAISKSSCAQVAADSVIDTAQSGQRAK